MRADPATATPVDSSVPRETTTTLGELRRLQAHERAAAPRSVTRVARDMAQHDSHASSKGATFRAESASGAEANLAYGGAT